MKAYEVISLLEGTSSKTGKEAIVTDAFKAGCFEFFRGAQLAYDKKVTFGTKTVPHHKTMPVTDRSLTFDDFTVLTDMMRKRHVTGGDATTAMEVTAEHCDAGMWDGFYRRVLLKDLRCGATESTINKALKALIKAGDTTAEKYLVPVFTCQLAHPRDKYEKLMKGKKFLDLKLDGVRILAVCDKEHGAVTLHTRNGLIKENFPQIEKLLRDKLIPKLTRSVVLDGEMVLKGFSDLMGQLNRKSNVNTKDAHFAIFDCIPLDHFLDGKSPITQTNRDKSVQWACRTIDDPRAYYIEKELVDLDTPEGVARVEEFHEEATLGGFEGTMVKDPEAPYVTKRSNAWLKIKPHVTVDLQIIECKLGDAGKKFENTLGRIHCAGFDHESGKFIQIDVGEGTKGSLTDKARDALWAIRDKLTGLTVEILGHEISKDKDGNYSIRHARLVGFRPDKDGTDEYRESLAAIKTELGIDLSENDLVIDLMAMAA
jgi:DNA ligase-1